MLNKGIKVEETEKCLLCDSPGTLLHNNMRDYFLETPGLWSLFECRKCGLVWLNPCPISGEIEKLYANYYTHSAETQMTQLTSLRKKVEHSILASAFGYKSLFSGRGTRMAGRILSFISPIKEFVGRSVMWLDCSQKGKLLDIGCGNGQFLAVMRGLGWEVQGIEPDKQACRVAQEHFGVQIIASTLYEARIPDDSFDAVTLSHVLEHVPDPIGLLRECNRVLSPTGKLVVVTPNIESLGHKIFGRSWLHLDPPRHFYLFSPRALRACAEQAGLRAEIFCTNVRSARWMWISSRLIKGKGKYFEGDITRGLKIEGTMFFFVEEITRTFWRHAGEELILIGTKNKSNPVIADRAKFNKEV